jgi:hypothetical protein
MEPSVLIGLVVATALANGVKLIGFTKSSEKFKKWIPNLTNTLLDKLQIL